LIKAQIAINAGEVGAASRQILVEQQARAVDGAVVIQFDRPLQVGQCLARLIERALGERLVQPRRGVVRVALLRQPPLPQGCVVVPCGGIGFA
jgi:hypothetical protein